MNIGNLLAKISRGEILQPLELEELRLWGNTAREADEYVKTLQNGQARLNIDAVTAQSGEFKYAPAGLSSFVSFSKSAIVTATPTNVDFTTSSYDELRGFSVSTTFKIPFTGKYEVKIFAGWGATTGGGYRQVKLLNVGYGYMEEYDSQHSSVNANLTNVVRGEASLVGGSNISIEVTQSSGGNLTCSGRMSIRLIRNYDGDIV